MNKFQAWLIIRCKKPKTFKEIMSLCKNITDLTDNKWDYSKNYLYTKISELVSLKLIHKAQQGKTCYYTATPEGLSEAINFMNIPLDRYIISKTLPKGQLTLMNYDVHKESEDRNAIGVVVDKLA